MNVRSAARTDPGRKRRGNEDAYVEQAPLYAIADGMGGAQAGEVASALAADALRELRPEGSGASRVTALIREANRRVHDRASTDATTSGMGTTITAAIVEDDGTVTFGHVGDSRAYLLRDNVLEQLTDDHSLVAELVRRGELSAADAEVHPQRSVITRALGTDPDIDVDTFTVDAKPGDLFLICSDGLSDMLDRGDLEVILRTHRNDLDRATRALIQAANKAGGEDNITAVLFEITNGEPDETTREYSSVLQDPVQHTDEDTLHPEDNVAPPPPADDTMIISVAELAARDEEEAEFEAGLGRRMLALAVIIALCVLIVALVWWGLAR